MIRKISETKIRDPDGKILVSQGLKVKHKKSGYEYTVDSVVKQNGKVYILLNMPDEPRLEPANSSKRVIDRARPKNNIIYEYEIEQDSYFYIPDDLEEAEPDKLAVPLDEFERNYGVS